MPVSTSQVLLEVEFYFYQRKYPEFFHPQDLGWEPKYFTSDELKLINNKIRALLRSGSLASKPVGRVSVRPINSNDSESVAESVKETATKIVPQQSIVDIAWDVFPYSFDKFKDLEDPAVNETPVLTKNELSNLLGVRLRELSE